MKGGAVYTPDYRVERKDLPRCTDFIRRTNRRLKCDVLAIDPPLPLQFWVDDAEYAEEHLWTCTAVWLHCADQPNGAVYQRTGLLHTELQTAINELRSNPGAARYTLLDAPNGTATDPNRFGGAHLITTPSGISFTFSVRRASNVHNKILLAIARNTT